MSVCEFKYLTPCELEGEGGCRIVSSRILCSRKIKQRKKVKIDHLFCMFVAPTCSVEKFLEKSLSPPLPHSGFIVDRNTHM